jgi:hypothetical protein
MENREPNQEADCVAIFLLAMMAGELNNLSECQVHYLGLMSMLEDMFHRESFYKSQFLSEFTWFMLSFLSDHLRRIGIGFLSSFERYPFLQGLLRPQFRKFKHLAHFEYREVASFFQLLFSTMDLATAEALGRDSEIAQGRGILLSMLEDFDAFSAGLGFWKNG